VAGQTIDREEGPGAISFYRAARRLFLIIAAPMFRFKVVGRDNVPPAGAAVVVAPHRSWLDPACVGAAIERPIRFLILDRMYHKPWARWFYRSMHSIPVQRGGAASLSALRQALRCLERGELVGIFPEGRVLSDWREGGIHPGAAMLALRTGAQIVPVGIHGSANAWPHGRALPGPARVSVQIGSPIDPPERHRRDAVELFTRRIEEAIRAL
jgi:1-acyl-sn-glycerol-3-phosphate acyltransferase